MYKKFVTPFVALLTVSACYAQSKETGTYLLYPLNETRTKQIWIGPRPIAAKTIPGNWTFYRWEPVDGDTDPYNYTPIEGELVHSVPVPEKVEPTPEAVVSSDINKELEALKDDPDLTDAEYAEIKIKLERAHGMSNLAAKKAKLEEAQQAKADAKTKDVDVNLNLKPAKPRVVYRNGN